MEKIVIGLIVNPVAGMGGSVGLKGTDGEQMVQKARQLGAEPVTPAKTKEFLSNINRKGEFIFLVAPGVMGGDYIGIIDQSGDVIGEVGEKTTSEDTKRIARQMVERGIELLIFVGGDGTARDIYDVIGLSLPVVAVPAGVKVYSSVFAVSARAAAELVDAFLEGSDLAEGEVLDIDEKAFRDDRLDSRLYGYLLVPEARRFLQHGKVASSLAPPTQLNKEEIAAFIIEDMDPQTLYLLGPGTTVKAIAEEMGLPKTLLGVDAVNSGSLVAQDLNERGILQLLDNYEKCEIIVTPIGGNGFIFGRGNKQFTPQVIRRVGVENIRVVSTRDKVQQLECLRVDSGDLEVDEMLSGYLKVWVDYREAIVMKVK